jgi:uncharacterized membrane protein
MKISADKFSPMVANAFIAIGSLLIAVIFTLIMKVSGQNLTFTKDGIKFLLLAGLLNGAGEIFYITTLAKGGSLTLNYPIVIGATTLVIFLLSYFLLKEQINTIKIIGVVFTIIGIVLLMKS